MKIITNGAGKNVKVCELTFGDVFEYQGEVSHIIDKDVNIDSVKIMCINTGDLHIIGKDSVVTFYQYSELRLYSFSQEEAVKRVSDIFSHLISDLANDMVGFAKKIGEILNDMATKKSEGRLISESLSMEYVDINTEDYSEDMKKIMEKDVDQVIFIRIWDIKEQKYVIIPGTINSSFIFVNTRSGEKLTTRCLSYKISGYYRFKRI